MFAEVVVEMNGIGGTEIVTTLTGVLSVLVEWEVMRHE